MLKSLNLYNFYFRLVSYTLPLPAFLLSGFLWFYIFRAAQHANLVTGVHRYVELLIFTTLLWAILIEHYRLTNLSELFAADSGFRAALLSVVGTYAITLVLMYLCRILAISRAFLALSAGLLLFLTLISRFLCKRVIARAGHDAPKRRILIFGADAFARRAASRLLHGPFAWGTIFGYIRLPGQTVAVKNATIFDFHEIANGALFSGIDDIVVALPPAYLALLPKIIRIAERHYLPIRAVLDFGPKVVVREKLFQFGGLQLVDLGSSTAESLQYLLFKRGFDVLFSVLVIVFSAPLMALIAAGIRLTSRGPVFFVQERVGLNGELFPMYKFRTMRVSSPSESDRRWTVGNDPRCTAFGRLLRKTSLDEMPQFFNVLLGHMSVVGPRPERPFYVNKFQKDYAQYNYRHRLKVGITGWAQVNGYRGNSSIEKRVEHDLYYLSNWSFAFDLKIILMTAFLGLMNKNAY
jgi:exopolysaccharide biosynthesis polyprenyl glycosylphosphotransferase